MKGIGIKHCEDKSENIITIESIASAVISQELINVNSFQYHKPFITDTLEIQQDKIDTRMMENRKLRPNQTCNWTRILGLKLRTSTSTSHATCKLETDHEALGCRPVTQLATHCLTRSSYVSQLTRNSDKYEIFIIWTMKISMTGHRTTKYNMDGRAAKNINRPGNQFLTDKVQSLFTAHNQKKPNLRKCRKQGY